MKTHEDAIGKLPDSVMFLKAQGASGAKMPCTIACCRKVQ